MVKKIGLGKSKPAFKAGEVYRFFFDFRSILFIRICFSKFDTEKFLDVHQVKFTGFRCPRPLFKFEHASFPGM